MLPFIACLIGLVLNVGVGAEPLVEGRIRLSSGLPAAGVQVRLFALSDLRQSVGTTTDATGYFALSRPALAGARGAALPADFALGPNYPNPFNPSTIIPYHLPAAGPVRLEVFNMLGQRLVRLVDGARSAGAHTAQWDGTDAAGRAVGAGVYIYRLSSGGMRVSRRMVLVDGQAGISGGVPSRSPRLAPAVQDQAYGLAVWGSDMVAYVDPAFQVREGMAPVDIVVEGRVPSGRRKVVAGGLLGDVNGDGRVDIIDALFVAMYSVDSSTLAAHLPNIALGDVDADGDLDFTDAYLIGTYSVNPLDPTLPAGIGQALSDPDPPTPEEARSALDEQGIAYTPASFFERIRAGDVSAVRLFIAAGMDLHAPGNGGRTVLMYAAWGSDVGVVRLLLDHGTDLHARDADGMTALMWAVRGGDVEVVRLLLDHGADINAQDKDGRPALIWAVWGGFLEVVRHNVEVVRLLVDHGADINARDSNGRTVLMHAAQGGDAEVVRLLLDHGADINAQANSGRPALMFAADEGHVAVVRLLLDHGANINAQSGKGRTALMWAAWGGHVGTVRLLLDHGANINRKADAGTTALMFAARKGHVAVVRLLVNHGADINAQEYYSGKTALMMAADKGYVEVIRILVEQWVAEAGAQAQDADGRTALSFAKESPLRQRLIDLLEAAGATE